MTRHDRARLEPASLGAAAGGIGLLAVVLALWPVHTNVPPRAPAGQDVNVAAGESGAIDRGLLEAQQMQVVNTNLFSSTRRAPTVRFRLPGLAAAPETSSIDSVAMAAGLAPPGGGAIPSPTAPDELVLLGLIHLGAGPRALLGRAAGDSAARLVGIGDRVGGYRVQSIGSDRVILESSSGSRTVRLTRPTPSDSSEWLP